MRRRDAAAARRGRERGAVHTGSITGRSRANCIQTARDGRWGLRGLFSSAGMNRGQFCLQANIEDVMSLPHCRTISGPSRLIAGAWIAEQSKGSIKAREHHMFCQQDREKRLCRQWKPSQQSGLVCLHTNVHVHRPSRVAVSSPSAFSLPVKQAHGTYCLQPDRRWFPFPCRWQKPTMPISLKSALKIARQIFSPL